MTDLATTNEAPTRSQLQTRDWCSSVREHSTAIIDDLIGRLQNLKATITLECDVTNHRMASFVTLAEDAIRTAGEIEIVVKKLEQSRTFTEAHNDSK